MAVCQPRICQGIFWILGDRSLKIFGSLLQVCAGPSVPKVAASQVKLMRLRIISRALRYRRLFRARELCLQRLSNRFRDLALHCENISEFSIVNVCPEMA